VYYPRQEYQDKGLDLQDVLGIMGSVVIARHIRVKDVLLLQGECIKTWQTSTVPAFLDNIQGSHATLNRICIQT
jgi:hypothetical protein